MNRGLFYFLILFLSIFLLNGCQEPISQPEIKEGILDLSEWDFKRKGTIQIRGDYSFAWKSFQTSAEIRQSKHFITAPGNWNQHQWEGQNLESGGFATYGLQIILPKQNRKALGLHIDEIGTSYRLYIEDSLISQIGNPQKNRKETSPLFLEKIYPIPEYEKDTITLVFQVANFHTKNGGIWYAPEIGEYQILEGVLNWEIHLDFFLLGSLVIIGFYHLGLFVYRPQERSTLYFSLLCLIIAMRTIGLSGFNLSEYWQLYVFEFREKISYLTFSLSVLVLFSYFYSLFPKESSLWVLRIGFTFIILYSLWVLISPNRLYSYTLIYFQLFTLLALIYGLGSLVLGILRRRREVLLFTLGFIILGIGTINDILHADKIINTGFVFSYTLFLFVLVQAIMLSIRFSKSFYQAETLGKELNQVNQNLENIVFKRTQSLKETTKILQTKNQNITESINYAQRIQEAFLPSISKIQSIFPDSFILFKPLATVSGDFYWAEEIDHDKIVVAVADCTGHGVPGAFMSLIAESFLRQIVVLQKIYEPNQILKLLDEYTFDALNQAENQNQDGMDISLCVIDKKNQCLQFAGARNGLIFIEEGKMQFIKGTKASLGGIKQDIDFEVHDLNIAGQDVYFYLFSDGFQDQFGGQKSKKFMLKNLRELILGNHQKSMEEQKKVLKNTLTEWMQTGDEPQIDDVTIMGVKLS